MNVVKVYGGLGNQMFQYAFGKMQEFNGATVQYDLSWYKNPQIPPRPFNLDKFNVIMKYGDFIPGQRILNEVRLHYMNDPMLLQFKDCNFYGYWQHPGYFTEILSTLRTEFTVKEEYYTQQYIDFRKKITSKESISLHVRRGDYILINGHHLLSMNYYATALLELQGKGEIFIFSDDIPWCKEHFTFCKVNFVEVGEEYLEFELMKLCSHNIIANSTFSWWAATLNGNIYKIVITPRKWRVNEAEQKLMDARLFLPEKWIQI